MDLNEALSVIETRAALVESRIKTNEAWLSLGFLGDEAFTPQFYILRAECQKELQRELAAMTTCLPIGCANARFA
jgi:hypothetical protein